jgi:hypothetical protein
MSDRYYFSRTDPVAPRALLDELVDELLDVDGVADLVDLQSQVGVDFVTTPTSGELTTAQSVVTAHDGTDPLLEVAGGSEGQASSIPGWAHWNEETAETWWSTYIDDPIASAPTVTAGNVVAVVQNIITVLGYMSTMLWALARMVIALRNKTWPNLQED